MTDYLKAMFDTSRDQYTSVSLDVGIIPSGYPDAGQFVVTIQALPIRTRKEADTIIRALKDAIGSRLGLRFEEAVGNA